MKKLVLLLMFGTGLAFPQCPAGSKLIEVGHGNFKCTPSAAGKATTPPEIVAQPNCGPDMTMVPTGNVYSCVPKAIAPSTVLGNTGASAAMPSAVPISSLVTTIPTCGGGTAINCYPKADGSGNISVGNAVPTVPGISPTVIYPNGAIISPGIYGQAFRAFLADAANGYSSAVQVIGDSTGDENSEWVYLLGQWMATRFPADTVRYRVWDDTSQNYLASVNIQSGAGGDRYVTMDGTGSSYPILPGGMIPTLTNNVLDFRFDAALTNWSPGYTGMVSHGDNVTSNKTSFSFQINNGNRFLKLLWSTDGTTWPSGSCQSSGAYTDPGANVRFHIRVVHTLNDGSGNNTCIFYTSADGQAWTKLGNTITNSGTVTGYYDANTSDWGCGNYERGQFASGKVYDCEIWNGGRLVSPPIDQWQYNGTAAPLFSGAPVIDIINGSKAGSSLAYWTDATRLPISLPNFAQTAFILSMNHNELLAVGSAEMLAYKNYITSVQALLPNTQVALVTQNPRVQPNANDYGQRVRSQEFYGLAKTNGYSVVDTRSAFILDPRWASGVLINSDGVHPTALGEAVWAGVVISAFSADVPR